MDNKNIYDLALHESTLINDKDKPKMLIVRVASGWLYSYADGNPVFVPFDNGFQMDYIFKDNTPKP